MKRALASLDPDELADDSVHVSKRWKPHNTDECAFKRRRLDTPPLTQETLDKLHCTSDSLGELEAGCAQSIQQWAAECENGELEMPLSPAPSVTPSRDSRRRIAKQVQRQRSSSPVKKANSPQYRAMNMADANVFVDHFPEAPAKVEEQIERVFGGNAWAASQRTAIEELARHYCQESRVLAKKCAGENEWRSHLFLGLLQPLNRLEPEVLMLSASEKPWIPELKPTAPSPYDFIPRHTPLILQQGVAQISNHADTNLATPQTQRTGSVLSNTPIFSMPSTAPSDTSESPNSLSTPKPDITLGLAHTSFTPMQKTVLMLLQDDCRVLSEPHQAQIGLRFPFLVIESKGGAAGGNLIGAQNQAAVDGACALSILEDLRCVVARIMSQSDFVQYNQENIAMKQAEEDKVPVFLFSVTTEGPLHEIWVHYRVGEAYHITCCRAWRTTRWEDAREFVQTLARIVEWGKRGFREGILNILGQIEEAVLGGVLTRMDESLVMS
ncbi:uncharacterized protein BDZ99DRAFT_373539 [Mytilinidion resinicola]|uniref:DUF7924 domain-containing protein n=1 Tax=Mytilinidion resinicola TaxID=574789 RepID=A0A6A6Z929_9PEZI|nr:uncharacterized protein BDZ99DRAFT_373539 [Mytilinidion resinicola]KAF2816717.1 hypothetical protein BDZ99DRAFT_373539 [Mytilinidion resinicola]